MTLIATIRGDATASGAYARARVLVDGAGVDSDANLGALLERPDVQSDTEAFTRLRYMYEAGGWVLLESAVADLPSDLRWLYESDAVTIPQLACLYDSLGTVTIADLAEAVRTHAIRQVPSLGPVVEARVEAALPSLRRRSPRIPLGRAAGIVDPILATLRADPSVAWALSAGSLRRGREMVGDVEVVASANAAMPAIAALAEATDAVPQLTRQASHLCLLIDRMTVGIRFPPPAEAGGALLYLTGSGEHVAQLRARAEHRGWRLTSTGLEVGGGRRLGETEAAIYEALDLPYIPPEIRRGLGEIDAADSGALPRLVDGADIVGDLHLHTHYSDGRDSVEQMAAAAEALGYRYIAITDHSPHSQASRTLSIDSLARQADEIAAARERHPGLTILHGAEVDILADGKLDFPDTALEGLDIVLASLHERHGHSPDRLLARYLRAVRHPLVHVITHPTNRELPHHPGYDLDYDRLFAAAVDSGTLVEIDGGPSHLDMPGDLAKRAIQAGVMVTIDSDCHRADLLGRQMALGVTTARRGWVEARHVVNTRPIEAVRALLAAKRGR